MEGRLQPPAIDEHTRDPGHDTYIVQVPKDQVYRIPPPENARIVEQHRNPSYSKKSKTRFCTCFFICLVILVVIAAIFTALYFFFKPTNPQISIKEVEVTQPASSKHKNVNPNATIQYLITLAAKNPNGKSGLAYTEDVGVDLYYDSIVVAMGKFPGLDQGPKASSMVMIELAGSKGRPLAPQMQKSMNASNTNAAISLELEMKLEMKGKFGGIKIYSMKPTVNCKMRLSSLTKDARVLSQKCKVD